MRHQHRPSPAQDSGLGTPLPTEERVTRWILLAIAAGLSGWGLLELFHEDYRSPKAPTDPYEMEAKRIAHAIKLPDSVPTASYYPWWLGPGPYYEFLCKHEAGEWILQTAEDVEGVFQMRPRQVATSKDFEDRFAMEDPYGYTDGEAASIASIFIGRPNSGYLYLETVLPVSRAFDDIRRPKALKLTGEGPLWRYSNDEGLRDQRTATRVEGSLRRLSRFGFTWRGIKRPHDRELGIAGGELIVVDLESNEVLGVHRGFARTGYTTSAPEGIDWQRSAWACPMLSRPHNSNPMVKNVDFAYSFISRVLEPSREWVRGE